MKLLYIAGPYNVSDPNWSVLKNIDSARNLVRSAKNAGWAPICPMMDVGSYPPHPNIESNLALLKRCDAILYLGGKTEENGGEMEVKTAQDLGIPFIEYTVHGVPPPNDTTRSDSEAMDELASTLAQCSKQILISKKEFTEWLEKTWKCYRSVENTARDMSLYGKALQYETAQKVVTIIKSAIKQDRLPTDFSAISLDEEVS